MFLGMAVRTEYHYTFIITRNFMMSMYQFLAPTFLARVIDFSLGSFNRSISHG